jgi:hypothetical protein
MNAIYYFTCILVYEEESNGKIAYLYLVIWSRAS